MKGDEAIKAQFQVFRNSALDGLKWSDLGNDLFKLGKKDPVNNE
jgi:hypothetical protein